MRKYLLGLVMVGLAALAAEGQAGSEPPPPEHVVAVFDRDLYGQPEAILTAGVMEVLRGIEVVLSADPGGGFNDSVSTFVETHYPRNHQLVSEQFKCIWRWCEKLGEMVPVYCNELLFDVDLGAFGVVRIKSEDIVSI